jgi:hypothetical protein
MGQTSFKVYSRIDRKLAQIFNSNFRCIDDVLSLNNSRFGDYLHLIYPSELEVKDTLKSMLFTLTFTWKSTKEDD